MYYVYVLRSVQHKRLYVGSCQDVEVRISLHNKGKVASTQFYKPWSLVQVETVGTRSEAMLRERFLKTGQQKELLRKKYC